MEAGLTKQSIIADLTKSPHGELAQYVPVATKAVASDPAFFSHLIAWNHRKGSIRDAKVALPVLALTDAALVQDHELRDNALAHMADLGPREFARAVEFSRQVPVRGRARVKGLIERYLREREASQTRFSGVAMQHRAVLKRLYVLGHVKPNQFARDVLFEGKKPGVFGVIASLHTMTPTEAAGAIMQHRIPFLVAQGALGARAKDPAVVQALIGAMSATELVTNTKALERLGLKTDPGLRATYEKALEAAKDSGKAPVLKTTRAAEAVGGSTGEKLQAMQEKQLDKLAVKGNWLVLCDKSGSMTDAIETARYVASVLARVAEGDVHLVFFDTVPYYHCVTGKSLEQIKELTKRVAADGGTSPGCGLQLALDRKLQVDGIALVADLNQNRPPEFTDVFRRYCAFLGKEVPLYAYQLRGDSPTLINSTRAAGIDMQVFDLMGGVDYYSLPTLVQTMRVNRYDLIQEVMDTPLKRLGDVFKLAA